MIESLLILLYVGSAAYVYNWFRIAYSKGGRWEYSSAIPLDIFLTLCPWVNTVVFVMCVLLPPKEGDPVFTVEKFFRIKK